MSEVTWGDLAKTVTDKAKISEEIDADVNTHNEDPSAHGQLGEGVYVHRNAEILDHLDGAVTLQKLYFNRFIILTHFESIDGWGINGAVSLDDIALVNLTTGAVSGNSASLSASAADANENGADPDNNPEFQTVVKFSNSTHQTCYVISGDPDVPSGYGFKVVNNTLYAWYIDSDEVEQTQEITGVTLSDWNVLRAVVTSATSIKFYVNGILKYTAISKIPTGAFGTFLLYRIITNENGAKKMYAQNAFYAEDFFN